jgi:hypothetical protein
MTQPADGKSKNTFGSNKNARIAINYGFIERVNSR